MAEPTPIDIEICEILDQLERAEDESRCIQRLSGFEHHSLANAALGQAYAIGRGCNIIPSTSQKFYSRVSLESLQELAEDANNAHAQVHLGRMIGNGIGVEKDKKKAVELFRLAAEQGHQGAQAALGTCYKNGFGVMMNYNEAVKWLSESAEQGNAGAMVYLGYCYKEGTGVDKDHKEAIRWWEKAMVRGNSFAKIALKRMGKDPDAPASNDDDSSSGATSTKTRTGSGHTVTTMVTSNNGTAASPDL